MILRPRQETFARRCLAALAEHGNTLGVAPTGAGKTVMLSAIAGQHGGRTLVLQHRDELVRQNRDTFRRVNPGAATSVYARWERRWSTGATFAMVPTLSRGGHLASMPTVDLVVVDEAHHVMAATYRRILDRARELNPAVSVLGVTATPNRGDKTRLTEVFSNLADQITLGELIGAGHLVEPRAFVMDVGLNDQLGQVRRTMRGRGEYDMDAVAELMDVAPVTERVIEEWRDKAGDRPTIVFGSTCEHAAHVCEAYQAAGVAAALVTGKTAPGDRARILKALDRGELQVLVNVAVATEGFDCPPISCVVLLRPSSFHSTMVQMIGRGLRTINPERYPGVTKTDCIVLDFGRSLLTHGGLEQVVDLRPHVDYGEQGGEPPRKTCGECGAALPIATMQCPLCGHQFPTEHREVTTIEQFRMVELELLVAHSPFLWWQYNPRCRVVSAIDTWAVVLEVSGVWHCVVGHEGKVRHVATGTQVQCISAGEDFMRKHGDRRVAGREREWLQRPPTEKQLAMLHRWGVQAGNRYEASCAMTLRFNRRQVRALVLEGERRAA